MSTSTHNRVNLTAAKKCELCREKEKNPHISNIELATQYGIGKSTVTDILKEEAKWLSVLDTEKEKKAFRAPKWPQLENALSLWVDNALVMKQNIDGNILKTKAKFFAFLESIANNCKHLQLLFSNYEFEDI